MAVVYLLISLSLLSNGSTCHNIKLDLSEIGWGDTDWIRLTKDRDHWRALVNTVMNLQVPQTVIQTI
jgi:hypothetical protein